MPQESSNPGKRILRIKEKIDEKKFILRLIQKNETALLEEKNKLKSLRDQLKKEHSDVLRLEGNGLAAFLYSLAGSKTEKLDKERKEYFSIKLRYEDCLHHVEGLEKGIGILKNKKEQLGSPELEYEQILEKTGKRLSAENDSVFKNLNDLLSGMSGQIKEIEEAISAGENVLQGLDSAIKKLKKAGGWGTFDMLGGGILSTAIKHSYIDDAKNSIHNVQFILKKFSREMSDVQIKANTDLTVNPSSFTTFADYFFDNLIFDWIVQDKIIRSLDACKRMNRDVASVLKSLNMTEKDMLNKHETAKAEMISFLESKEL